MIPELCRQEAIFLQTTMFRSRKCLRTCLKFKTNQEEVQEKVRGEVHEEEEVQEERRRKTRINNNNKDKEKQNKEGENKEEENTEEENKEQKEKEGEITCR